MNLPKNNSSTLINNDVSSLLNTVVNNGYCIGCGACAVVPNSPIKIELDRYGRLQAKICKEDEGPAASAISVTTVCPFSDNAVNEDVISSELFKQVDSRSENHPSLGYYRGLYAGHVQENDYRKNGSSGGMGSWLLAALLQSGKVDAVVHVHRVNPKTAHGKLFSFAISNSVEQIKRAAKSHYYPVEMSEVLNEIKESPGRYAVVGIPCFIKAVRLLMKQDPVLNERIHYTVGLFCGHLKSTRFAGLFSWQNGIHPDDIQEIDFRYKLPDSPAHEYGVKISGTCDGQDVVVVRKNKEHFGYIWGHGFFKYRACDYCDDVVAETADIAIGDAWLPEYVNDSQGTNIVIVRNNDIKALIEDAIDNKKLALSNVTPEQVVKSQLGGLKHRRQGLSYRVYRKQRKKEWCPRKRVSTDISGISWKRRLIYRMRVIIAEHSHKAFELALKKNDFEVFRRSMSRWLRVYGFLYKDHMIFRIAGKIRRIWQQA